MGVDKIPSKAVFASLAELLATHLTKKLTNVFGILQLTLYIDIWSPLKVHQPKAISDKSPVPITKPLCLLA
jgi:hypothetical protein